jgi:hypothetical protein
LCVKVLPPPSFLLGFGGTRDGKSIHCRSSACSAKPECLDGHKGPEVILQKVVVAHKAINNATSGFNNKAWNLDKGVDETLELHTDNLMTENFVVG